MKRFVLGGLAAVVFVSAAHAQAAPDPLDQLEPDMRAVVDLIAASPPAPRADLLIRIAACEVPPEAGIALLEDAAYAARSVQQATPLLSTEMTTDTVNWANSFASEAAADALSLYAKSVSALVKLDPTASLEPLANHPYLGAEVSPPCEVLIVPDYRPLFRPFAAALRSQFSEQEREELLDSLDVIVRTAPNLISLATAAELASNLTPDETLRLSESLTVRLSSLIEGDRLFTYSVERLRAVRTIVSETAAVPAEARYPLLIALKQLVERQFSGPRCGDTLSQESIVRRLAGELDLLNDALLPFEGDAGNYLHTADLVAPDPNRIIDAPEPEDLWTYEPAKNAFDQMMALKRAVEEDVPEEERPKLAPILDQIDAIAPDSPERDTLALFHTKALLYQWVMSTAAANPNVYRDAGGRYIRFLESNQRLLLTDPSDFLLHLQRLLDQTRKISDDPDDVIAKRIARGVTYPNAPDKTEAHAKWLLTSLRESHLPVIHLYAAVEDACPIPFYGWRWN